MADRLSNPQAIAKQQGGQLVRAIDLGDGVGLVGFELKPVIGEAAEGGGPQVGCGLFAIGGRTSAVSLTADIRSVFLGEIGAIPLANLKRMLAGEPAGDVPSADGPFVVSGHPRCGECTGTGLVQGSDDGRGNPLACQKCKGTCLDPVLVVEGWVA